MTIKAGWRSRAGLVPRCWLLTHQKRRHGGGHTEALTPSVLTKTSFLLTAQLQIHNSEDNGHKWENIYPVRWFACVGLCVFALGRVCCCVGLFWLVLVFCFVFFLTWKHTDYY